MADFNLSQVHIAYGAKSVLEEVSFLVNTGDRIGLVGPNGAGKSSLMRLLAGELEAESGSFFQTKELKIGYLRQNVHIESDQTVYQTALASFAEVFRLEEELADLEKQMGLLADQPQELSRVLERHQALLHRHADLGGLNYDSLIRGTLKGLGFRSNQLEEKVSQLSGGEKSRLELAQLFFQKPDVLLLDEPTNHLDLKGVNFLEKTLATLPATQIIISHDRYFLDRLVHRIFFIDQGRLRTYKGNYHTFQEKRAKEREVEERAYKNQQEEIARQEEIISRLSKLGGSKRKRGIAQARSRQRLLDKMKRLDKPSGDLDFMHLRLVPKYPSGEEVLHVEGLSKSYDRPLFSDLTFDIRRGQRVGLVGDNGMGKTTLFRLILGQEKADQGRVYLGPSVKMALFDQERRDLSPEKTVLDELWDAYPDFDHYHVRAHLARFQFQGERVFQLVQDLSGGEQARLSLLKLMLSEANFLLLDEPTNHLDMDSREVLEEALRSYEGTVFVISHDRYFLNRVADHIFALQADGLHVYLGNYDSYQARLEEEEALQASLEEKPPAKKAKKKTGLIKAAPHPRAKEANDLLQAISALEEEQAQVEKQLADPALYEQTGSSAHLADLSRRHGELLAAIEEKTQAWMEAAEKAEADQ